MERLVLRTEPAENTKAAQNSTVSMLSASSAVKQIRENSSATSGWLFPRVFWGTWGYTFLNLTL